MKKQIQKSSEASAKRGESGTWWLSAVLGACIVILLLFPFLLRFLGDHFDFCQRVIEMDALSYYGVAFGLFASFLAFVVEKRRNNEQERLQTKPIITLDICEVEEMAYIVTLANRGMRLQRNIFLDGDRVAADIDAGQKLTINVTLFGCEYDFNNEYKTVEITDDNGKLPKILVVHCTDVRGQIWCHVFNRFEDFNGVHYNLAEREIDGEETPI